MNVLCRTDLAVLQQVAESRVQRFHGGGWTDGTTIVTRVVENLQVAGLVVREYPSSMQSVTAMPTDVGYRLINSIKGREVAAIARRKTGLLR
jgi:hypothetical protein